MKDIFRAELFARELFVVSALLGYKSVFGIEDDVFLSSGIDMKAQINRTVQQLERKKLIRYDLDGTLYIKPEFRRVIECICCADTVGFFSSNIGSGKSVSVYILEKNTHAVMVENFGNGKYKLCLSDRIAASRVVPKEILGTQCFEFGEMMLLEEAQFVQEQMDAFNAGEAKLCIERHVHDKASRELITRILSKKCRYMSYQIHKNSKHLYKAICNGVFVCDGNRTISVSIDNNDVLSFKSVSLNTVLSCIDPYLSFCKEEDVQ